MSPLLDIPTGGLLLHAVGRLPHHHDGSLPTIGVVGRDLVLADEATESVSA
ncbi:hypothetical protein ACWEQ2_33735 [Streptomyces sp. NPDC004096]|uniref:hypothetical protein n=1 Tax=unclassified Streptomyces TaxID=2593676 RepID=UPI0033B85465